MRSPPASQPALPDQGQVERMIRGGPQGSHPLGPPAACSDAEAQYNNVTPWFTFVALKPHEGSTPETC